MNKQFEDHAPPALRPLLLSSPHPRFSGGVAMHCNALERVYRTRGLDVRRFYVGTGRDDDNSLNAKLHGLRALAATVPRFARAVEGTTVHLNPSFTPKSLIREGAFLAIARGRGCKVVVEFHGGSPRDAAGGLTGAATKWLCRGADAVVVINRIQHQQLRDRWPSLEPRLHLIPNGVTVPSYEPKATSQRFVCPRFLFLSRLIEEKGPLDAIRAVGILRDAGKHVALDVAGDGEAMERAKELVHQMGLGSQVTLHGRVDGEAKEVLLRQATVFLFPSYYPAEGLPVAVIEAFAAGLPVIAADIAPVNTIVEHGKTGLLVPPRQPHAIAQAMRQLTEDKATYERFSVTSRDVAEREYDLESIAGRFIDLYSQLAVSS